MKWILGLLLLLGVADAQIPDVRFHLDLYGSYDAPAKNSGTFHLYSPLGNASSLQIQLNIDQDLKAFISERIEQFPHDPSKDPLEQYYIEDQGIWRLGKQYLPFGSGTLVRENVLAAETQTKLLYENTKLDVALCEGGSGVQQGIVGRIGNKIGASVAVGDNFGISPTSFDLVRAPGDSPGRGRGWKEMYGLDGARTLGKFVASAEAVWLVDGETSADKDQFIYDLSAAYQPNPTHSALIGYSQGGPNQVGYFRATGNIPWTKSTAIQPLLRFRSGRFFDVGVTLHVRL